MLYNQKKLWDEIFRKRTFHPFYLKISGFANECIKYFSKKSKIFNGAGNEII